MAERFAVETDARLTSVDVTDRVAAAVPDDADGVCTAFVRHTTAALVVQENESGFAATSRVSSATWFRTKVTLTTNSTATASSDARRALRCNRRTPTRTSARSCSAPT